MKPNRGLITTLLALAAILAVTAGGFRMGAAKLNAQADALRAEGAAIQAADAAQKADEAEKSNQE